MVLRRCVESRYPLLYQKTLQCNVSTSHSANAAFWYNATIKAILHGFNAIRLYKNPCHPTKPFESRILWIVKITQIFLKDHSIWLLNGEKPQHLVIERRKTTASGY